MEFVAYIDREGTRYPPPERAPGSPVVIDVDANIRVKEAINQALVAAGLDSDGHYYWPHFLQDAREPNSRMGSEVRVGIGEDGELIWAQGAFDRLTIADLQRARDQGLIDADPCGVFLERPQYGDGVLPGWEEFFGWLANNAGAGVVGGAAWAFLELLKKMYTRWRDRGATSPYAFLDLVLARKEWKRPQLARLLGLSTQEATDLLESMGFEPTEDQDRWVRSSNRKRSALRRQILRDHYHRPESDELESGDSKKD